VTDSGVMADSDLSAFSFNPRHRHQASTSAMQQSIAYLPV